MASEDGIPENLQYVDVRSWRGAAHVRAMLDVEEEMRRYQGDLASDEAWAHFSMSEYASMGFDCSVGASVLALLLVGAVPLASCRGGEGHFEGRPIVAFWADEVALCRILDVAERAGVEVFGVDGDRPCLCISHSHDVLALSQFAELMLEATGELQCDSRGRA